MESRVSSRLSAKRYETTLNEVFDEDVNFKTYLYKVDIYGHNITIAPGKVIYDTDIEDLVYCYIYAIQEDKPVMKLGVYEKIEENKDTEVFNLEDFKEGSMLVFEYFETNPSKITELESIEQDTSDKNPFDLINESVFTPSSDIYKFYESSNKEAIKYTKDVFNHIHSQYKSLEKDNSFSKDSIKIIKHILKEIRESFGSDKKFNLHTIEFMKSYCGSKLDEKFTFCLAVLASYLKVKFIVMNPDGNVYNDALNLSENMPPFTEPTHYVVLKNYELYYNNNIQPFGTKVTDEPSDTKIYIQVFKIDELPDYLKTELQNVSAENSMMSSQAEEQNIEKPIVEEATVEEPEPVTTETFVSKLKIPKPQPKQSIKLKVKSPELPKSVNLDSSK